MSTSAEVPVSLIESLSAQYDAQLENDPARPETEQQSETVVDAVVETVTDAPVVEAIKAPEHWPQDRRAAFERATPEIQKIWMDRETEMERGITQKGQELRDIKARNDQYETVIGPLRQSLQLQGTNEFAWLGQMAAYTTALQNDPLGVIRAVASQYNVDLSQLGRGSDEFIDPGIKGLKDEIQALKAHLSQTTQSQQTQVQQQHIQALESFRSQKGADGAPLHPHFDSVLDDMTVIASGFRAQGKALPTLDEMYQRAVRMRPELTEAERHSAEQARQRTAIETAKRAKGASARPRDTATDAGAIKPQSLRDLLAQQYDAMNS